MPCPSRLHRTLRTLAQVVALTIAATCAAFAVAGVVSSAFSPVLLFAAVISGFVQADLADALRQRSYWPEFDLPVPPETATHETLKVSGIPAENALKLALVASAAPTATDLGAPPVWSRFLSLFFCLWVVVFLRDTDLIFALLSFVLGFILRIATPFGSVSRSRITALREKAADAASARLKGAAAERNVGNVINRSPDLDYVLHAKQIGPGDIDHILIGPFFAAVETKSGGGHTRVKGGVLHAGSKSFPANMLSKVTQQATILSEITNTICTPIVCIENATGPPKQIGGVWVCGSDSILDLSKQLDVVFDKETAATAYNRCTKIHRKNLRRRTRLLSEKIRPRFWKIRTALAAQTPSLSRFSTNSVIKPNPYKEKEVTR